MLVCPRISLSAYSSPPAIIHCERVSEIVEVKVLQADAHQSLTETMLQPPEATARRVCKYEIRSRCSWIVAEQFDDCRAHRDVPRLTILGLPNDHEA